MLKFAYTYRKAINRLTDDRTSKLQDCVVSEEEWEDVKHLHDSLRVCESLHARICTYCLHQIFKTVTLEFSTDIPCLASVIPAMDKMHNDLTTATVNEEYLLALRAALTLGTTLLNKYYSLTDKSDVYRIAMG